MGLDNALYIKGKTIKAIGVNGLNFLEESL